MALYTQGQAEVILVLTVFGVSDRQLRLLLKKGDIEGRKLGHDWVVLSPDYKRKPKSKKGGE